MGRKTSPPICGVGFGEGCWAWTTAHIAPHVGFGRSEIELWALGKSPLAGSSNVGIGISLIGLRLARRVDLMRGNWRWVSYPSQISYRLDPLTSAGRGSSARGAWLGQLSCALLVGIGSSLDRSCLAQWVDWTVGVGGGHPSQISRRL